MSFTADHQGFYHHELPFFPLVQDGADPLMDWSNMAIVCLPAHLSADLDWEEEMQIAEQVVLSGKYIFWEMDLGLSSFQFTPDDSASFFSFSLALEEFSKKVWPKFQEHTFGIALYRGAFHPRQSFPIAYWEAAFVEGASGNDYDLYCAQLLSEYLHRLVSFLPESVLPFAFIDAFGIASPTRQSQLFSKERFEYMHLALKGARAPFSGICWEQGLSAQGWLGILPHSLASQPPASIGIYLPSDAYLHADLLKKMDLLIIDLQQKEVPFRIVSEEKLTEQWDGLDQLIVPSSALSAQGKRKLLGFIAAGGTVLYR